MSRPLITLRFDKNFVYFMINLATFILIYRYDGKCKKGYVYELANLISILVSLICMIIKKNAIIIEKNSISKIKAAKTEKGMIIYEKKIHNNYDIKVKKGHIYIILIYILFNIVPFLRDTKIIEIKFLRFLSNTIFLGIIITGLFMKQNIYNHHLISIIALFLMMFIYPDFIDSIKENGVLKNILGTLTYYISRGAMRRYFNYLMLNEYIDPFYISIIDVSIVLFKNILSYIYAYSFLTSEEAKKVYLKELNLDDFTQLSFLIGFILYYISIIINPIFDILTSYYYTPFHQCLVDILGSFLNTFIIQIEKRILNDEKDRQETDIFIQNTIIAIINVFFSGVLAEIIILNFCDLNKNTKREIEKRGIYETNINELASNFSRTNITQDRNTNDFSESSIDSLD